MKCLILDK